LGDDQMLSALVINLIDNAIKYSGDRIELTLSAVSHEALLEVCDFGQGVKSEDSRKIFEKFYRVGNEQSRTTKGTGLGLYIVQNVAKLHAGQVEVRANKPKGSIFVVSIPLNESNG
jgi:signal transduction histidine kinase